MLEAAHNLSWLDLESNHLTNVSFPSGLTDLNVLDLSVNQLINFMVSEGAWGILRSRFRGAHVLAG